MCAALDCGTPGRLRGSRALPAGLQGPSKGATAHATAGTRHTRSAELPLLVRCTAAPSPPFRGASSALLPLALSEMTRGATAGNEARRAVGVSTQDTSAARQGGTRKEALL